MSSDATCSERENILKSELGDDLFKTAKDFFSFLFKEEDTQKPLGDRVYIFLTRKGFALWHAWVLSGLLDGAVCSPSQLISDRNWLKMTVGERRLFTGRKHVYIVDDSVVTGDSVMSIYVSLNYVSLDKAKQEEGLCASRNVVCMSAGDSFTRYGAFESFKYFKNVSVIERREQNARIMKALYALSVPFTSELPVYRVERADRGLLNTLQSLAGGSDGWEYIKSDLDFGAIGVASNTFLLRAPGLGKPAENFFFRGVRVCYRELSKTEDPERKHVEISIIPWVMFDFLDYAKTIQYIFDNSDESCTWLRGQIANGEPERRQIVIHRVISYLFASCIYKKFRDEVSAAFSPYQICGNDLEKYHFNEKLLTEIHALVNDGCNIIGEEKCPYHNLIMNKETHDKVRDSLTGTDWLGVEIPNEIGRMRQLGVALCEARERDVNKDTGLLDKPKPRKKFPIAFYDGGGDEDKGITALKYVRLSIASFQPTMFSAEDRLYLANVLVSGEGSALALVKDYDFIWGLQYLLYKGKYTLGIEKKFGDFWNSCRLRIKEYSELPEVDSKTLEVLGKLTPVFWPSRKELLTGNGHIDVIIGVVDKFWKNLTEGR